LTAGGTAGVLVLVVAIALLIRRRQGLILRRVVRGS
jgi:hypothetical protein